MDSKKRISELPESKVTKGLYTLGTNAQNESVKVPLGELLDGVVPVATEAKTIANEAKNLASSANSTANQAKTVATQSTNIATEAKSIANNANSNAEVAKDTSEDALLAAQEAERSALTANNLASIPEFKGMLDDAPITMVSITDTNPDIFYIIAKKVFVARYTQNSQTLYANNWNNANLFMDSLRANVLSGKFFRQEDKLYYFDKTDNSLKMVYDAQFNVLLNQQDANTAQLKYRMFINANILLKLGENNTTFANVRASIAALSDFSYYKKLGVVLTFKTVNGWESWQWLSGDWNEAGNWKKFGGSASVGNCYNVTNDEPLAMGYYSLEQAISKCFDKGYTTVGIQLTFAIADKSWKTYQYVGVDSSETNFKNVSNWLDLAGMSAGAETLINVDALCGTCTVASFYTLQYAIAAILALQTKTGITYAKGGLVITYKVGDNAWETKQFKGVESDFGEISLWQDFGGGGGSTVETKDTPESGGKDAFSTGGAYALMPTDLSVNTEESGVVKISMKNADNEVIGNEIQFAVGTGGGGEASGTVITIAPEASPLYTKAGGSVMLKAAIRSVTAQGGSELFNIIERVELYDRDTNQLLETYRLNQASSADIETFDFEFDLSKYFPLASQRKFKLIAYDDSDHSGSRNINVTAVDVTIKSEQTLNYTASTAVLVGGAIKSLPMYRFANNASDKGILCTVEIYLDSEWKTLGTATISDTYSHSISINPNNCLGKKLTHGAYNLRIHGVDVASGVIGNYLYTSIMVVDSNISTPIVVSRWYTETLDASVKQYETISVDFAAYSPAATQIQVNVIEAEHSDNIKQTTLAARSSVYSYVQRISGMATDGSQSIKLQIKAADAYIFAAITTYKVLGTLLDIEPVTTQLMIDMDMSDRSNADADKSIKNNGYTLAVNGSNYSTNGFVKDSFGTAEYGTENDKGVMALRIAENVTASLNYAPFNQAAMETNGLAIQFRIRTRHIEDDSAKLISCIANGFGFYVNGKDVVFTTDNASTVAHTITAAIKDDSLTDVAIVIEPSSIAPYAGIGVVKMFFDGELIGSCYYDKDSLSRHDTKISFDGTKGDLYLYNIRAWETYYSFEQSFNNYLLKLNDTDSMILEYNFNGVMASQAAEGKPAINRPQAAQLYAKNMAYFVVCKNAETEDTADNYPDYLETLNGDKKTARYYDIYAYFPNRPWQDFKAIKVKTTNQGTTSSMRPIKNDKFKLKGCVVELLHSREEFTTAEDLAKYDECAANAVNSKVQILDSSIPTNIITVKVDYSESGGANNGASTQLYNELQIALGSNYKTPAQNYYTGKYTLNSSIDSIPIAFFRTDQNSSDATSPSYGYFHAKGNWNQDKGDAAVFGFEKCAGYNDGCLNYGDFVELIAARNQSLNAFAAATDKSGWDKTQIYVLSEFCGPKHMVFRYADSAGWRETTGKMEFISGRWRISGDVVNPVENYELLAYNSLDWFQGVDSVDDMLTPDTKGVPIWMTYFESRYPDNDDLNAAYEDGRKVPYQLYRWLEWCQQCNQNLDSSKGNITIDGTTVSGTKDNRLKKFKRELHKMANVHSMICYHVFTDYIAAVDQRSKNMMVGFYLETDGTVRMYLNHLYDGDTIMGSDNDCGLTIDAELDPNNDPEGRYQGHDSVLFTQIAASDYIWLKDYTADSDTSDSTKTVTVASVASAMRSVQLKSGLRPFSKDGIKKYWITDRLEKWQKLVSSYDGIRKYIEHSTASDNYFYALHGLSIQRLEDFVDTRFRYRDGFYQCGDTFSSAASMRCTGTNMSVTIKAAKDGFFGLGVDRANEARESCYLKAGESRTLNSGNTNLGSGVMLYIFGADRVAELNIRRATPKQSGWDISKMVLLKKLIIGGSDYSPATNIGEELSTLNLGQMPFLEELDVRRFPLTSIDATYSPRLKKVYADGSKLQTITIAQTSPIDTLALPNTMTALSFVNLPNLSYPNGGLTIEGIGSVKRFLLSGCSKIDTLSLMKKIVTDNASIKEVYVDGIELTSDTSILYALKNSGARGIGSDSDTTCDGLKGTWLLSSLIDDSDLSSLQSYFTELTLHNAQYTMVCFDDTVEDPKNITNLDNNTSGANYEASGHLLRIKSRMIPVKGKLNTEAGIWEGEKISLENYRKLANGTDFDFADTLGNGFDAMMRAPHCWFKGINDFKNQKKYIAWSSLATEPISSAHKTTRKVLNDILYKSNVAVITTNAVAGSSTLETSGILTDTPNYNTYKIDVAGMKQIRYPGLNNAAIGAVFLNSAGTIISKYNMAVSNSLFDFVEGDYIFINVPSGAQSFVFASKNTNGSLEAIATDSTEIEAIEPDWVESDAFLGGIYEASIDSLTKIRSISNAPVRVGTGTAVTSPEWTYDSNGKPTNTPVNSMNYTYKDFQNLAARRGDGYQLFDYEMSKFSAILWMSLIGNRDVQLVVGYGQGTGGTTGYRDTYGVKDSERGIGNGNKALGFESFVACTWEVMDNIAVNVPTYAQALKDKMAELSTYPIDAKYHIYDPIRKTERVVQGITVSGYCIGRVKHGRNCDIIVSKTTSDNSVFAKNYCDVNYYSAARCRAVGRASSNANAFGGLVYAYAVYAFSNSVTFSGSRLAFRGKIKIDGEELDEPKIS